ncbi:MAG: fumarylacetoacetate hydrolase family protein [Solirubrobacterales bacterium]|nr:fumarylacetoacetate hydrolase family protein [Solirubrobacterales bacterium]
MASTPFGDVDRLGALAGEQIVDLSAANAALALERDGPAGAELGRRLVPSSVMGLLGREQAGMEAAQAALDYALAQERFVVPLSGARLKAPLPRPNSIRDFMVVEEHVRNSGLDVPDVWYEIPVYWKGNADTVFGPGDEIRWPAYTEKLDYELELAAVIGRHGRSVSVGEAPNYIAGYTLFNDWSARDIQMREMKVGLGPGLGKDFATSMGPCLVTADEIDPSAITMQARVSGETWSSGTLGAMRFGFAEIISHISQEQPLVPGDVLGSGTLGGGCGLELDRWIQPGDVIELEADSIGVLANRVVRD